MNTTLNHHGIYLRFISYPNCSDCETVVSALAELELSAFDVSYEVASGKDIVKMRREGRKIIFPIVEAYKKSVVIGRRCGVSSSIVDLEKSSISAWLTEMEDREVVFE